MKWKLDNYFENQIKHFQNLPFLNKKKSASQYFLLLIYNYKIHLILGKPFVFNLIYVYKSPCKW